MGRERGPGSSQASLEGCHETAVEGSSRRALRGPLSWSVRTPSLHSFSHTILFFVIHACTRRIATCPLSMGYTRLPKFWPKSCPFLSLSLRPRQLCSPWHSFRVWCHRILLLPLQSLASFYIITGADSLLLPAEVPTSLAFPPVPPFRWRRELSWRMMGTLIARMMITQSVLHTLWRRGPRMLHEGVRSISHHASEVRPPCLYSDHQPHASWRQPLPSIEA